MRKYIGYNKTIKGEHTADELAAVQKIGAVNAYLKSLIDVINDLNDSAPHGWRVSETWREHHEPTEAPIFQAAINEPILIGSVTVVHGDPPFWVWAYQVGPGRPPLYDKTMKQTAVRLPQYQIEWLSKQPGGMAETIRKLVDGAINSE